MVTQIEIKPRRKRDNNWTEDEVDYLIGHVGKATTSIIAHRLGRSENAVRNKISQLHILSEDASTSYKIEDVAYTIGRSVETIQKWIEKGTLKSQANGKFTTNEIRSFILKHPLEVDQAKMNWISVLDILVGKSGLGNISGDHYGRKEEKEEK